MKSEAVRIDLTKQFFQVHGINEQAETCSTHRQLTLQATYSAFSPARRLLDAAIKIHPHQCAPAPCHDVTNGGYQKNEPDTGLIPSTTTQGQALNKKNLSESDLCDKFIRPAIEQAGWNGLDQIYREYPLRAGRVVVRRSKAQRDKSTVLRADYALFFKANIPLAVVEAKDSRVIKRASGWAGRNRNSKRLIWVTRA